jgi:hypothetical protein
MKTKVDVLFSGASIEADLGAIYTFGGFPVLLNELIGAFLF